MNEKPICPGSGEGVLAGTPSDDKGRIFCPKCGKLTKPTSWNYIRRHLDALS